MAEYYKKEETDEYYYLFISTIQAIVIPKRALKSETEKKALENLFARCLAAKVPLEQWVKN